MTSIYALLAQLLTETRLCLIKLCVHLPVTLHQLLWNSLAFFGWV